ncbi:hypothetical protein OO013_09765 [Mangrovivirga sp. M17]|uniref:Uncharacterized protein n=1 Tax=Mangrovivirga halotolerans TaxID=2993936 RepID=A0ABT3RRI0_9BACT|nr:hypothetical protein [Mangrovivirga halotolerans]MCX2744153.1 hypothetical protein [Mangrovivirga halotolerans]
MPKIRFEYPARYRIKFQGRDFQNLTILNNLTLKLEGEGCIVVEGEMKDQAELLGVLNTLYDNHYSIVSVQFLEHEWN